LYAPGDIRTTGAVFLLLRMPSPRQRCRSGWTVKRGPQMTFDEVLAQVLELLQREGRVSYRALKWRFSLDDDYLEDLKDELIKAKQLARDEEGAVLVWIGDAAVASSSQPPAPQTPDSGLRTPDSKPQTLDARPSDGESGSAVAAAGQERRSAADAGRNLRLVHGRIWHQRLARGEGTLRKSRI
jgi:hypothetical protein